MSGSCVDQRGAALLLALWMVCIVVALSQRQRGAEEVLVDPQHASSWRGRATSWLIWARNSRVCTAGCCLAVLLELLETPLAL